HTSQQPAVRSLERSQMKYENDEYRALLARAQKAALSLAQLACYEHVEEPALLPPALRDGLNVPSRRLTILPAAREIPRGVTAAVVERRTDLPAVRTAKSMDGAASCSVPLLPCGGGTVPRQGALRLWAGIARHMNLVLVPCGAD